MKTGSRFQRKQKKLTSRLEDDDFLNEPPASFSDWIFESVAGFKYKHFSDLYEEDLNALEHVVMNSQYPPITLGRLEDGRPFYVSLEQLQKHQHYQGATGKGKSTTFIGIAYEIIERGQGLFKLDMSEGGDTVKKLLGHCQRNNIKYLYIDLNSDWNPVINPFDLANKYKSIVSCKDAFQVLWNVKDSATTGNISKYLPAVLRVLVDAELTIAEAKWFTSTEYKPQQKYILKRAFEKTGKTHAYDLVVEALSKWRIYERFISTTTRLEPLIHPAIEALFGGGSSVDLTELMKENYVILVNLALDDLDDLQKRFVGTMLVNQIIYHHPYGHPYWLFIDEAEDYASSKVGEILDKKAKTGLHIGLLNHHLDQFEDLKLRRSVEVNTPIKFEFPKRQEAWVTLNEMDPVYLRMPVIYTEYGKFKHSDYFRHRNQILNIIKERIPYVQDSGEDNVRPRSRKDADSSTTDQGDFSRGEGSEGLRKSDRRNSNLEEREADQSEANRLWNEVSVLPASEKGAE